MKDFGISKKQTDGPQEAQSDAKMYPSFIVSTKVLPELKKATIGKKMVMILQVKVSGSREDYDDKDESNLDIKILKGEIGEMTE